MSIASQSWRHAVTCRRTAHDLPIVTAQRHIGAAQPMESPMQMTQVKDSLDRIEQCIDQAADAMRQSNRQTPDELRRCVDDLHAQAREVRDMAQQSSDGSQLTSRIDRLEQTGDRAKQACQSAGGAVDPQLQSAVMQAHDQISSLKKQLH
jgi:uncharacterized protein Yka (UPF0111/DUF47 family)